MENQTSAFKKNLTQVILIVFSVVLGVYLSERIEERNKLREADDLLSTINLEVKDNLALLKFWVPYHQTASKNLINLSNDPEFIEQFIQEKFVFFKKVFTRNTVMGRMPVIDAWEIAKSHPLIVSIDYDKYLALSRIYNQQKVTFENVSGMFEIFEGKDVNARENAQSNLELISNRFRNFVSMEEQLMVYYKDAEETLGLQDVEAATK